MASGTFLGDAPPIPEPPEIGAEEPTEDPTPPAAAEPADDPGALGDPGSEPEPEEPAGDPEPEPDPEEPLSAEQLQEQLAAKEAELEAAHVAEKGLLKRIQRETRRRQALEAGGEDPEADSGDVTVPYEFDPDKETVTLKGLNKPPETSPEQQHAIEKREVLTEVVLGVVGQDAEAYKRVDYVAKADQYLAQLVDAHLEGRQPASLGEYLEIIQAEGFDRQVATLFPDAPDPLKMARVSFTFDKTLDTELAREFFTEVAQVGAPAAAPPADPPAATPAKPAKRRVLPLRERPRRMGDRGSVPTGENHQEARAAHRKMIESPFDVSRDEAAEVLENLEEPLT